MMLRILTQNSQIYTVWLAVAIPMTKTLRIEFLFQLFIVQTTDIDGTAELKRKITPEEKV